MVKLHGDYPEKRDYETIIKSKINLGTTSLLLVKYESSPAELERPVPKNSVFRESKKSINIFIGGPDKWCIHCEIHKNGGSFKPMGYLVKIRYDILCSLTHNFSKGKDTKQIMILLLQYLYNNYPSVKELNFNDMSTKKCDNKQDINLAVMTYLYSGKTWYEKNFGAYLADYNINIMNMYIDKLNKAKHIPWDEMKETINIEYDNIEELYNNSKIWKEFFETIYKELEIADFCNSISPWIDSFILKYFNNLQGLNYLMPVNNKNLKYTESEYVKKGGRYTRKAIQSLNIDYKV